MKYQYSWLRFVLLQKEINDDGFRWIDGRYDQQKSLTIDGELTAGEYYALVIPEWEGKVFDLHLILRSKNPIRL